MITQEIKLYKEPEIVVISNNTTNTSTNMFFSDQEIEHAIQEAHEAGLVPGIIFKYKTGIRLYKITGYEDKVRKSTYMKKPYILKAQYVFDPKLDKQGYDQIGSTTISFGTDEFIDGKLEIIDGNQATCC